MFIISCILLFACSVLFSLLRDHRYKRRFSFILFFFSGRVRERLSLKFSCCLIQRNISLSLQWTVDGLCGQCGLLAAWTVGEEFRSDLGPALTRLLWTGERSVRACLCRRSPVMHSAQVRALSTAAHPWGAACPPASKLTAMFSLMVARNAMFYIQNTSEIVVHFPFCNSSM